MVWLILGHLIAFLVDLLAGGRRAPDARDREIVLLRHQLRILLRKRGRPPRLARWERLTLAVLVAKLADLIPGRGELRRGLVLVQPATVYHWHRELVRRKWACTRSRAAGRPPLAAELEALVLRLAAEYGRWGYSRIHGERRKLGYAISRSAVRDVLKRHRVATAPQRGRRDDSWRAFLRRHRDQLLACDFFTVETLFLKTVYALFFIEVGTRQAHLAGCTARPTGAWVTQRARQFAWTLQVAGASPRFLIHDRDTRFPPAFDAVFVAEGLEVVRTPYRSPTANAYAERWVGSVRAECLRHVLADYVAHYNRARPHQGLGQQTPLPFARSARCGQVRRRDVLGGLIHEYDREAA